jgi:hypothetical protein
MIAPATAQLELVRVIEILSPLLTGSVATIAFFAGWFAHRQRRLRQMRRLLAAHERGNALASTRLADVRRQAALLANENSMLRKEIVYQETRSRRAHSPRAPTVEPVILRTPIETIPDGLEPVDDAGFPDTQPWESGSA